MRTKKTAWELAPWMRENFVVFGAEGEGDGDGGEDSSDSGDDGDDEGDDEDEEDDDSDLGDEEKNPVKLKSALEKERLARREAEKKAKTLEKEKAREQRLRDRKKQSDTDELATAKKELEESNQKSTRLAAGFKRTALDRAIETAATALKFRDTDDALKLVDRDLIDVEQDEDEPDKVDIDKDSVKRAVKKLADAKKHLLQSGTEDGGRTGSQFGNSGNSNKKPTKDEELKKKYSSLR